MRRKTGNFIYFLLSLILAMGAVALDSQTECRAAKKVLPKKIKLQGEASKKAGIQLKTGEKITVQYQLLPKKTKNKKIIFSSSNKGVAKVTSKGVVSGVKEGTATITLRAKAKKTVKARVKVTVVPDEMVKASAEVKSYQTSLLSLAPVGSDKIEATIDTYLAASTTETVTGLTLNKDSLEMAPGESFQLSATVTPVTSNEKVTWSVNPLGGINVYSTGNVYVTEDTPIGTTAMITASCGKLTATCVVTIVKGPCEHEWGDWAVVTDAKCMAEGVERSICKKCSKVRERAIAATGHSWLGKIVKQPTCTEVGEWEYVCQNCGETKQEIIKATGHTWSTNGTILEEPTCIKAGKIEYKCTVYGCDGTKTESIAALGHNWDAGEITKSPNCTERGVRTYHCTVQDCSGIKKESIDATGHTWTYGEVVLEPTCEKDGKRSIACLTCGAKSYGVIEKFGHDYDAGTVTKEATCEESGETTYICGRCGNKKIDRKLPEALGHSYEDPLDPGIFTVDKEPTCTKTGLKSIHCTNTWHDEGGKEVACTRKTDITKIPALGHAEKKEIIQKQNCVLPEITKTTCTRDGCNYQIKEETKPAAGHDWGDPDNPVYALDKEPTCETFGRESIHCQNVWDGNPCGEHKGGRTLPMLDHNNWVGADVIKKVDPTCTQDGYVIYQCKIESMVDGKKTVCGKTKQVTLPALGHSYNSWTIDREPTCTVSGEKSKHCTNTWLDENGSTVTCTKRDEITAIPPLDHKWSAWVVKKTPTHDELGYQEKTCADCGAVQRMSLSGGHGYDSDGKCQASGCGKTLSLTAVAAEDWEYKLDETNHTILLKKYIGTSDCVKIPAQMSVATDGNTGTYDVVFAGGYEPRTKTGIFASNSNCSIRAVSFEDGVKLTDMQYMFYGCDKLEAVLNIPSTVTNMTGTFKGCTSLVTVSALPAGLTELPATFQDCKKLSAAPAIPAGVKSMDSTFKNCEMLTTAPVLPAMLQNLDWTFSGCTGISTAPAIPATVTEMTNTFENSGLLEVPTDIPAGVTKLTMTFYGCAQLDRVTMIPPGVTTMEYTFKNCKNLIYAAPIPSTVTRQIDIFVGCDKLEQ